MTDQELIAKLNSLKKITPDQKWLKSNRELLLSQVSNSGAEKLEVWKIILINFSSALKSASQPVYALGVFVLLLVSSVFYSQQIFAQAKPNDSLYIARIISEKLKLNTTFNTEERDKLAVQFATGHAQDISAVLSDPQFNTEENKDQVAKLNDSFKAEVNTVKDRISRLAVKEKNAPAILASTSSEVIIAENSKDGQGIQLLENHNAITPLVKATNTEKVSPALTATSTDLKASSSTKIGTEQTGASEADKILDEATKLFNQKDYTKASDKLKEVDEIIK